MKIKRFNESLDNNQIKEWIEDLLVPIVDSGFEYEITQGETSYKISFFDVVVPNMTKELTDYTIFDNLSEFYGEMKHILTTLGKQFDVVVETSGSYIGVILVKKGATHLPEFMELDGNTIWVDKLLLKANLEIPIWGCELDGEWRLEIELRNNFDETIEYMKNYFRFYNIFDCDVYGETFVVDLKGRKYNFRMK